MEKNSEKPRNKNTFKKNRFLQYIICFNCLNFTIVDSVRVASKDDINLSINAGAWSVFHSQLGSAAYLLQGGDLEHGLRARNEKE